MSPRTLREKAKVRLGREEGPEFQIAPMIDILLAGVSKIAFSVVDPNPSLPQNH